MNHIIPTSLSVPFQSQQLHIKETTNERKVKEKE